MELSRVLHMDCKLLFIDAFESIMNLVLQCTHLDLSFFSGGGGEFLVPMKVYHVWVEAKLDSVGSVTMGDGRCDIVGNLCKR